jgi:WD40 repeat protein
LAALFTIMVLTALLVAGAGAVGIWQEAENQRRSVDELRRQLEKAQQGEARARDALDQVLYLHRVELAHREWLGGRVSRCLELLAECPERRRNWEYHYVRRLPEPLLTLRFADRTIAPPIQTVAFSPDGKRVIGGNRMVGISLWDAETGRELFSLEDAGPLREASSAPVEGSAASVVFSPDGLTVAGNVANHAALAIWDAASGKLRRTLRSPGLLGALAFHPDGRWLAGAAPAGNAIVPDVIVIDTTGEKEPQILKGHRGHVEALAYSPDGKWLASGSTDKTVKLWNVVTGQEQATVSGFRQAVQCVGFSADSSLLAAGTTDGTIKVWRVADRQDLVALQSSSGAVHGLVFLGDNQRLATAMDNGAAVVWDVVKGEELFAFRGHLAPSPMLNALACRPDGKRLATASSDGTVNVWDTTNSPEYRQFVLAPGPIEPLDFSAEGWHLLTTDLKGGVTLWDLMGSRPVLHCQVVSGHPVVAALAPKGTRFAVGSGDGSVKLFDSAGSELFTLPGSRPLVRGLRFSPNGERLAVCSGADGGPGELEVWNLMTRQSDLTLSSPGGPVTNATFSPDGERLTWLGGENEVHCCRVSPSQAVWDVQSGGGMAQGVLFAPDGSILAVAHLDGAVELRSPATGKLMQRLKRASGEGVAMAFSPDSKRLATGGPHASKVDIWDVETGQAVLALSDASFPAFSGDGHYLFSCGTNGTLRVWDATPLPMER